MKEYLPFYMVYGVNDMNGNDMNGNVWDEERMGIRDYEYMKSAYPDTTKRILPFVERECDRMEYSGSMMFDEYPDQLQVRLMCRRVYDEVIMQNEVAAWKNMPEKWLFDMIQVLVWHEIMKRRGEYRKYRRKFY